MSNTSSASGPWARAFRTPLGTVIEVSTASFLQNVLPPLRHKLDPGAINDGLRKLAKKSSSCKPISLQNRWRGFAQDPACHVGRRKPEDAFRYFPDAVHAIVKAGGVNSGKYPSSVSFRNNPNCEMRYLNRGNRANIDDFADAFLFKGDKPSWMPICVSGEYMQTDHKDNIKEASELVLSDTCH